MDSFRRVLENLNLQLYRLGTLNISFFEIRISCFRFCIFQYVGILGISLIKNEQF